MRRIDVTSLLAILVTIATPTFGGRAQEPTSVVDLEGRPVRPLEDASAKATVLVFVGTDCPISNRYAPEIKRLQQRFAPQGVAFWLVYAQPAESLDAIRHHRREYFEAVATAVRDAEHQLVKRAAARVTPEAAVFVPGPGGARLVYHGRIDDRYVDLGRARAAPTAHDLEDALTAVVAGRPAPRAATPAIGCFIADAR
jgi:AhpC/TSA family